MRGREIVPRPYFVDTLTDKLAVLRGRLLGQNHKPCNADASRLIGETWELSRNRTSWTPHSDKTPYFMDAVLDKIGLRQRRAPCPRNCPGVVLRCRPFGQNPVLRGRPCWTKKQQTELSTAPALDFVPTVLRGRLAVHHSVQAVHRSVRAVHRCQNDAASCGKHCDLRTQNFY